MALSIRARSRFPHSQSLSSGSFHKPFILIHQRMERMKNAITENWPNWSLGSQSCLTHWNYEPWQCRATQDGKVMVESSDKTWSTEKGNSKPFQYSCLENPMNTMKRQKDRTLKDELQRSVGADLWVHMILEKSREIASERMKRLSQSENNVNGDRSKKSVAIKNNTA